MGEKLREFLEPMAAWFATFNLPEPIIHWGHPAMMATVVFVLGSFVGFVGWRGRVAVDGDVAMESRTSHRKLAPWMFLFITLGYTGGVLSLVMQEEAIFSSPHFWTGSTVILLLGFNGLISFTGFGGNQSSLRTLHAYLGSITLGILIIHAVLGLKLGLSI